LISGFFNKEKETDMKISAVLTVLTKKSQTFKMFAFADYQILGKSNAISVDVKDAK
jgi:hypothetical protein